MANRIKDTDYLGISARIRAMENSLLTAEGMERLLEARTDEEVEKILQEYGYPELKATDPEAMDQVLSANREAVLEDLSCGAPDRRYVEIFKLPYDYHNAKALVKAAAIGASAEHMLVNLGRVPAQQLRQAVESGDTSHLPQTLAQAVAQAQAVMNTTRDPQLSDMTLDSWMYREMGEVAQATGSKFLQGYVRTKIDAANLRTAVRTMRMGKGMDFLQGALFSGGDVSPDAIIEAAVKGGSGLEELYGPTVFAQAAQSGAQALQSGGLTEFEKRCDDAVSEYLSGARAVAFGEAPLLAYLAAKDTEYTNLRIFLLGRSAGLSADVIRSRLRESCV